MAEANPNVCSLAEENLYKFIAIDRRLPNYVFNQGWSDFQICESDWVFEPDLPVKMASILLEEGARCACMVNFDSDRADPNAIHFFSTDGGESEFRSKLVRGGTAAGWAFEFDRFGCSSDLGTWCMYMERGSEICIVGFSKQATEGVKSLFSQLFHTETRSALTDSSDAFPVSGYAISEEWRIEILKNYKD